MAALAYELPTRYPGLRESLAPPLRALADEQIEDLFARTPVEAADVEGFLSDLQQVARVAAPIARVALPVIGTAVGGPVGAAVGGLAGQAIGALAQSGTAAPAPPRPEAPRAAPPRPDAPRPAPPRPDAPRPAPPGTDALQVVQPPVAPRPNDAPPAQPRPDEPVGTATAPPPPSRPQGGPPGSPAAGQLVQVLGQPSLMQALMSMVLGPNAGSASVPVGRSGTQVPVSAFANLLGSLASKAFSQTEAMAAPSSRLPEYLYQEGVLAVDPANPDQRAERLMALMQESVPRRARAMPAQLTEADEFYDQLDAAELIELIEEEGGDLELDE
ncbi:hypothetical protein SAMN05444172_5536 [Burkholderia sp. GAS332]|nr:hypothetical protein SAMN05444172_5536 [Burkholderia sp. GAS332]